MQGERREVSIDLEHLIELFGIKAFLKDFLSLYSKLSKQLLSRSRGEVETTMWSSSCNSTLPLCMDLVRSFATSVLDREARVDILACEQCRHYGLPLHENS